MPRYELVWAEYAREQYESLRQAPRRAVAALTSEIRADPTGRGSYDQETDRYSADFVGEGVAGLVLYLVGERRPRVVILRVTVIDL
jgi:hypothetical protein